MEDCSESERALVHQAVEKTGLGVRIANLCISVVGKTSLGVAYGLALAELALSPAMPSTTARAGGVFVRSPRSPCHHLQDSCCGLFRSVGM